MARIGVIGAAGFVGRHLVPLLLAEGTEVRVMVRNGWKFRSDGVDLVRGDVRDRGALQMLARGCEFIIHLAPGFSNAGGEFETVTEGTSNVVQVAREAGVSRLVYLSCLGADAASHSAFYAAKWKAEQIVRGSDVPFVIVRPSLVVGRGDGLLWPLAALIRTLPVIPLPGKGEYRHQPIDVEDLARCISMALSIDAVANESVSVGGTMFVTLRQMVDLVAGQLGVAKPKLLVPYAFSSVLLRVAPSAARGLYTQPRLSQFRHGVVASPGIVQRTFRFEPRPIIARLGEYLA